MATLTDEKQEEKIEEVEEEEEEEDDKEEEVGSDDEQAGGEANEEKDHEKLTPQPVDQTQKKQDGVLNLNNEVVRMRMEVKRVRTLIIRKLTRQIAGLKKKKGKKMEVEKNQRRAARLLEEIHVMKVLVPDLVTKTALQKTLNFEQVCKNPKSSISDRAVARIATHPQFNRRIELIKAAVKAFKEERMKGGKQGRKDQAQNQTEKSKPQSKVNDAKRGQTKEEKDEDAEVVTTDEPSLEEKEKSNHLSYIPDIQEKKTPETQSVKPAPLKSSERKQTLKKNKPQTAAVEKQLSLRPMPDLIQKKEVEAESDLEASDNEEKEYFDDSTEERFHKQSSGSGESDDDDFFLGKVSKFKKKKKKTSVEGEKQMQNAKGCSTLQNSDAIQNELDELESRLASKRPSLKSVFCSSLSGVKQHHGGGAADRGGKKFSKHGKQKDRSDGIRDFTKKSKFQKHDNAKESKSSPGDVHTHSDVKGFASASRGWGQGRGDFIRQKDHRGGGVFSQQALHPSWEASKKRKEQQGQILAFQGKKIKFDDDD